MGVANFWGETSAKCLVSASHNYEHILYITALPYQFCCQVGSVKVSFLQLISIKSLKSEENYIYLLYCNSLIITSVDAIAKVNGVFVFRLNNSKKLC